MIDDNDDNDDVDWIWWLMTTIDDDVDDGKSLNIKLNISNLTLQLTHASYQRRRKRGLENGGEGGWPPLGNVLLPSLPHPFFLISKLATLFMFSMMMIIVQRAINSAHAPGTKSSNYATATHTCSLKSLTFKLIWCVINIQQAFRKRIQKFIQHDFHWLHYPFLLPMHWALISTFTGRQKSQQLAGAHSMKLFDWMRAAHVNGVNNITEPHKISPGVKRNYILSTVFFPWLVSVRHISVSAFSLYSFLT